MKTKSHSNLITPKTNYTKKNHRTHNNASTPHFSFTLRAHQLNGDKLNSCVFLELIKHSYTRNFVFAIRSSTSTHHFVYATR